MNQQLLSPIGGVRDDIDDASRQKKNDNNNTSNLDECSYHGIRLSI